MSKCTRNDDEGCHKSASNKGTKALAELGKYHAGVVIKNKGQFECSSILGAGSNIKQHKDQDAFEVLVVKS